MSTTYRPEQFRVRALADGLQPTVSSNNIHFQKIVNAKSETGGQERVPATLERESWRSATVALTDTDMLRTSAHPPEAPICGVLPPTRVTFCVAANL